MTMDICVFEKAKLIKFNNRLCLMTCAVLVKQDNKSIWRNMRIHQRTESVVKGTFSNCKQTISRTYSRLGRWQF